MTKLRRPAGKYGEDKDDDSYRPASRRRVPSTIYYEREFEERSGGSVERSLPSQLPLYPEQDDDSIEFCHESKSTRDESESIFDRLVNSGDWEGVLLAATLREFVTDCTSKAEDKPNTDQTSRKSMTKTRKATGKKSKKRKNKNVSDPYVINSSNSSLQMKQKRKSKSTLKTKNKKNKDISKNEDSKSKQHRTTRRDPNGQTMKPYRDIQVDPLIESPTDLNRYSSSSKTMLSSYFSDCDPSTAVEPITSAHSKDIHDSPGTLETHLSSSTSLFTSCRSTEKREIAGRSFSSKKETHYLPPRLSCRIKTNNPRPDFESTINTTQNREEAGAREHKNKGSILRRAWKAANRIVSRF